jgi:hypothetical protein
MSNRRQHPAWIALLLALALLLAQQLALAHAFTHLAPAAASQGPDHKHPTGDAACAQCLAMAQLGAGPPVAAPAVAAADAAFEWVALAGATTAAAPVAAYQARAPPTSLH